jgi:Na+/H+-dicarboxylate symporter
VTEPAEISACPSEGIGALPVLDRLLDMARTAINVFADAVCTVIVARLESGTGVLSGSGPELVSTASATDNYSQ